MPDASYADPQNSSAWLPTNDHRDPAVYQGSMIVPDLCGGGPISLQEGGTFTAIVSSM
jgi:hypothetical protein